MIELYKTELGFEQFWGDDSKFAAIGHEKALFITVPIDRAWFPTSEIKSKILPIEVQLEGIAGEKIIKMERNAYKIY